jgi:hypothetical protein
MKKLSVFSTVILILFFTSCKKVIGEGALVTETRTTANFDAVESQISGNITFVQSPDFKVEITAQQNILDVMETPVINNRLVVRFRNNVRVKSHEQITTIVKAPSISSITSSGSGDVNVLGPLNGNSLVFKLNGSGNIYLPVVTCNYLETTTSGSGDISIAGGTAETEHLKISGSGNINAQNVLAKSATTTISGSGSIKVSASETLNATISGSGSVYYWGRPVVSTSISGSGRVIHQ